MLGAVSPLPSRFDYDEPARALLIEWDDAAVHRIPFEVLRRACPCAACHGEMGSAGRFAVRPTPGARRGRPRRHLPGGLVRPQRGVGRRPQHRHLHLRAAARARRAGGGHAVEPRRYSGRHVHQHRAGRHDRTGRRRPHPHPQPARGAQRPHRRGARRRRRRLPPGRRGRQRPRGGDHRGGPRLLLRPGPPRRVGVRRRRHPRPPAQPLRADDHGDARAREAGDRLGQRRRRRGGHVAGARRRLPHRRGSRPPSSRHSCASASCPTPAAATSCRAWSAPPRRSSWRCSATPSTPRRRCGSAWCTVWCPTPSSAHATAEFAARLARAPRSAGLIKQLILNSLDSTLDEQLQREEDAQALAAAERGLRRRHRGLHHQARSRVHRALRGLRQG